MCFGFTLAVGSAFTTGLPRLLPKTVHIHPNPLVYPSIVLTGIDDLLDDRRAVHGLVQGLGAESNPGIAFTRIPFRKDWECLSWISQVAPLAQFDPRPPAAPVCRRVNAQDQRDSLRTRLLTLVV